MRTRFTTTARGMVRRCVGTSAVTDKEIGRSVEIMLRHGWLPNYVPKADELDRSMVFVSQQHRMAAVFRHLDSNGRGIVPVPLVESRTGYCLDHPLSGVFLSICGLALVAMDGNSVMLRGTSTGMATAVNWARRWESAMKLKATVMIEHATGLVLPPEETSIDLRRQVARYFEEFYVGVNGLVEGNAEPELLPFWQFPPVEAVATEPPF